MMKWKKYIDERPREEHRSVAFRHAKGDAPEGVVPWEIYYREHEWLDHLDDSDNGWIPVSERKPTKEDGCPDGPMLGYVYAQFPDGVFSRVNWNALSFDDGTIIAWQRLPEPYVPPEPLWESDEDRDEVAKAYFAVVDNDAIDIDVDYLQRELLKLGYAIRKLEGK